MNRNGLRWTIVVAALGLGGFLVVLGANLLPAWMSASKRGITAQLILTWLMIGSTSLTALILAAFLVAPTRAGEAAPETGKHGGVGT